MSVINIKTILKIYIKVYIIINLFYVIGSYLVDNFSSSSLAEMRKQVLTPLRGTDHSALARMG
jgi:hypothetical protein